MARENPKLHRYVPKMKRTDRAGVRRTVLNYLNSAGDGVHGGRESIPRKQRPDPQRDRD